MSENLFGLTVAADKGLDDLQCQRLLSENRRYQEVMLQYRCALIPAENGTAKWSIYCTSYHNASDRKGQASIFDACPFVFSYIIPMCFGAVAFAFCFLS